jgi:DNA (cytosine-5)-methyltransferase 1
MRYASVCDGIGAAHVAWKPLGWQCQWTSEIEPFPAAVVEHHYGFRNLGDMTAITEEMLDAPVELLVGGTPCQSFSVAGLRGGLADPRGNLALRFVQLAAVMQPKWIVWENVPGVLSSGKGRDFGTFLGALGELGYGFAYRVLDAQWFGVAQRRRRVFVVGHLGDWRRAAAVLFERESVFGHPPTRGKAWEGVARSTAASLTSSGRGVERPGESRGQDDVVLGRPMWRGGDQANSEHCIDHAGTLNCDQPLRTVAPPAVAFKPSHDTRGKDGAPSDVAAPLSADADKGDQDTVICFDILGTPATNAAKTTDVHSPLRSRPPGQSEASTTTVVAFAQNQLGEVRTNSEVMGTVNTNQNASGRNTPMVAVAQGFTYSGYSNQPAWMTGDRTDCLPSGGHSDGSHQGVGVVAFKPKYITLDNPKMEGAPRVDGTTFTCLTNDTGDNAQCVATAMAVRRLTPRECERLQGFPDDYTLVEYRKKPAADGPRYRALGNSMAVPVMRWIGERIEAVERLAGQP